MENILFSLYISIKRLPQRSRDWVLKIKSARGSINLQGHQINFGIIKLDPSNTVGIGTEPQCPGVGNNFFFINPVTDTIEYGAGLT